VNHAVPVSGARFVVTGGLSLLGEHLGRELLDDGADRVTLIDNLAFHSSPDSPLLGDQRVDLVRADVRDVEAVTAALEGADGVFHTAAFVTIPLASDPLLGIDVNVKGTETVLRAAVRARVRKVVISTSVAVYGDSVDDPITESSPFRTVGLQPAARLYGASKIMAEAFCELYARAHSLPCVSLRYASLYGEGQRGRGLNAMHLWEAHEQMARGEVPEITASATEAHDYLYSGDAAQANLGAMASDVGSGAFTIATGRSTTLADAVALLAELMNFPEPARFRSSDRRVRFSTSETLNYDVTKAAAHLGWTAKVSLREGLSRITDQKPMKGKGQR